MKKCLECYLGFKEKRATSWYILESRWLKALINGVIGGERISTNGIIWIRLKYEAKVVVWIITTEIVWIRLKYEAKVVMWIITRGIVWISFKHEAKVAIWIITRGIVWFRINIRQKLCHYVTAFASTTYLTCLEMLRSHLSFNISFFP